MADVEKININSTDYDIADAKALRNKDTANTGSLGQDSFIDTRAGTSTYPTTGEDYNNSIVIGKEAYGVPTNLTQTTIIGNNAYSNSGYGAIYGYGAHTNGTYTTALGRTANANANYATAVGDNAYANSIYGTAIGSSSQITTGSYGTMVGAGAYTNKNYTTGVGMNVNILGDYGTATGYNASISTNSSYCTALGARSSITNSYTYYSTAIGYDAKVAQSYAVQLGAGTNNNHGSLQFKNYPLVDSGGKIYEERLPGSVRFTTDEPTVLDWQDDDELRKMVLMYTGEDNDLFTHGLCYQAKAKQGHPKFWCGWTSTDYIPRNECVQIDNEKLFLKLAEISKARYEDDGDWRNSLIGGDNAEQVFYFYYNVDDAQWHIEISNDTLEYGFRDVPNYYYFEQGETLEDFGIYVKDLTLPTDEGADEEMFDIYYYAPCYCDGYSFGSDIYSVNYMTLMEAMIDSDWGFAYVIDDLSDWSYTVPGRGTDPGYTYNMPVIPETYISSQDSEEYDGVTVRWEWLDGSWHQYINGEDIEYDWTTAQLEQYFGIVLDGSEVATDHIEFYFRGAKQLYWEQFNPIDASTLATKQEFNNLSSSVNQIEEYKAFKRIQNSRDLDTMTTTGQYRIEANGCTNLPTNAANSRFMWLFVSNYASSTQVRQVLITDYASMTVSGTSYSRYAPNIFVRCKISNSWSSWKPLLTDECSPWITGFDKDKKQFLIHDTSNNIMKWEEGSGSAPTYDSTNERITW